MRYNKILSILLILSFGFLVNANFELPPEIKSTQAVKFLVYLQREIPWLLQEGAEYDISFLEVIKYQNQMVKTLSQNPEYISAISKRGDLVTLNTEVLQPTEASRRATTKDLERKVSKLVDKGSKKIEKERAKILEFAKGTNYRSALTGLIKELAPLFRFNQGDIFKLSPSEQVKYFRKQHKEYLHTYGQSNFWPVLTQQTNFSFDALGISSNELETDPDTQNDPFSGLLDLIDDLIDSQNDIFYLGLASFLIENENVELSELINNPEYLTQIKIEGFSPKELKKIIQTNLRSLPSEKNKSSLSVIDRISIREVPPYLGLFRGIVGGDCSTSFSGPMAYAPLAHTYFVYDSEGNPKGYVQATEVQVNGKGRHLYLHDVTGCRMSVDLLSKVVDTFAEAIKDMGFSGLVLPTVENNQRNQNYLDLRAWLDQAISDSERVNIDYLDNDLRRTFSEFQTGRDRYVDINYDLGEYNAEGHKYSAGKKKDQKNQLQVSIEKRKSQIQIPTRITSKEVVILYLSLTSGSRSKDAQEELRLAFEAADQGQQSDFRKRVAAANAIAKDYDFDTKALNVLGNNIVNPKRTKQERYFEYVRSEAEKVGVKLSDNDIKNNEFLFYDGYLRATLQTATKNIDQKQTSLYMIALLKRWPKPLLVSELVRKSPEVLEFNAMKSYIRSLVKPDLTSLTQLKWLLEIYKGDSSVFELDRKTLEIIESDNKNEEIQNEISYIVERVQLDSSGNKGVCSYVLQ